LAERCLTKIKKYGANPQVYSYIHGENPQQHVDIHRENPQEYINIGGENPLDVLTFIFFFGKLNL